MVSSSTGAGDSSPYLAGLKAASTWRSEGASRMPAAMCASSRPGKARQPRERQVELGRDALGCGCGGCGGPCRCRDAPARPDRRQVAGGSALQSTSGAPAASRRASTTPVARSFSTRIRCDRRDRADLDAGGTWRPRASAATSAPMPPLGTASGAAMRPGGTAGVSTVPGERGPSMAAEDGVEGERAGQRVVGISSLDRVGDVHRRMRRNSRMLRLAQQAQAQGQLGRASGASRQPPSAEARRRRRQHGRQHAGEAGEALAQGGEGGGIGDAAGRRRAAPGRAMTTVAAVGRQRPPWAGRWRRRRGHGSASSSSCDDRRGCRLCSEMGELRHRASPARARTVRAAPPTASACSSTRTLRPALASVAAATRPLWPPPMTMASKRAHAALPVRGLPRSRRISRAALAPGAPMTPPPGWVEEPHM